jgi:hypothetical protein
MTRPRVVPSWPVSIYEEAVRVVRRADHDGYITPAEAGQRIAELRRLHLAPADEDTD